jgi:hypothetical protein
VGASSSGSEGISSNLGGVTICSRGFLINNVEASVSDILFKVECRLLFDSIG